MNRVIEHERIKYIGDHTHGWSIVIEGSSAEKDPEESSCVGDMSNLEFGGIVGCSEWMWLDKEVAERLVACWNACAGIENPEVMREFYNKNYRG